MQAFLTARQIRFGLEAHLTTEHAAQPGHAGQPGKHAGEPRPSLRTPCSSGCLSDFTVIDAEVEKPRKTTAIMKRFIIKYVLVK